MRQLLQSVKDGKLRIIEAPTPSPGSTEVLVATTCSLVSAGTEKAVRELASGSLLAKAKARPDLVRQVVAKARAEGIQATRRAVQSRLQDDMPLGYSAAGRVLAVGEAVSGLLPGMRVATASAGHGDHQIVPGLLAVPIPDEVTDSQAAFGAVAAIALQGLRQADVQVGGTVAVIGLGLIGQLTVRLAVASGLSVVGVDLQPQLVQLASSHGAAAFVEDGDGVTRSILGITRGNGVDAVLVTAATTSSEPAMRATQILRDRGRLVIVGDVGLNLKRTPFYEKELEIRFARSYGPGRYERAYEDYAIDYPIGHVRWTEGRNIEAYLNLVASGRLNVDDLVSRTYPLEAAQESYAALAEQDVIGVQFIYETRRPEPIVAVSSAPPALTARPSIGLIGAGNFVQATLLPAFERAQLPIPRSITSSGGTNAARVARKFGIPHVSSSVDDLLSQKDIDTVMVLSSHDSHAALAVSALQVGKHVYVEKPLALTDQELDDVVREYEVAGRVLWTGFNRRYAPMTEAVRRVLSATSGPLVIDYRVNAGTLPQPHWYHDRRQGGRLLGEVCHFIDTASWVVGSAPIAVTAFGDGQGESLLQQNFLIGLRYPDGSVASVTYSSEGSPSTSKEQIDIHGRGHSISIDNFTRLSVDGRRVKAQAGKGHVDNLTAFRRALLEPTEARSSTMASVATTRATIAAARSLLTGKESLPC